MTQTMNTRYALTLLLLMVTSGAPAAAQTAGSFEQLALLVESGDRITVTDSAGREQTGRIVDLSPSALALLIDGARRDFREVQVHSIRQWRQDSLKNGAWFGLAVGAALGATALNPRADIAAPALFLGIMAAAGAGVGVGLDALVPSRQVIYQSAGTARRVTVAPLVARDRRGLAVSFGF